MDRPVARAALWMGLAVLGVTGLAVSAIAAPSITTEGGKGHEVALVAPAQAVPHDSVIRTVLQPSVPAGSWIATLHQATTYDSAPGGFPLGILPATNPFSTPQVMAVVDHGVPGWVQVELPVRPNGSLGWIPTAGVSITQTTFSVKVDLAARKLTVYRGSEVVLTSLAAVGKPSTPTPTGRTFLWELIRPNDPNGAYGPYIFGLAWFSDAYAVFNGGDAQIGIHGQDEPWSIGEAASHGCVRLPNPVIAELATMLPLGTPVTIS